MMAALTVSALTPVASIAAETEKLPTGFYDTENGSLIPASTFMFMTVEEKLAILKSPNFYFIDKEGNAIKATAIIDAKTDEVLEDSIQTVEEVENELEIEFTPDGVKPVEPTPPGGGGVSWPGNPDVKEYIDGMVGELISGQNMYSIDIKGGNTYEVTILETGKDVPLNDSKLETQFDKVTNINHSHVNLKKATGSIIFKDNTTVSIGKEFATNETAEFKDFLKQVIDTANKFTGTKPDLTDETKLGAFAGKTFNLTITGDIDGKGFNSTYKIEFK